MSASTQMNQRPIDNYQFFKDTLSIRLPGRGAYIELGAHHALNAKAVPLPNDKVLRIVSDRKKLIVTMHPSFYHFYLDCVGRIIEKLDEDPNTEIIIHKPAPPGEGPYKSYVHDSFLEILESKGIRYQAYNLSDYDVLEINNVILMVNASLSKDYASGIFEFFADQVRNPGIKPHRDIFLSRRQMGNRSYPNAPDWAWANHDNRIDSHEAIENYFASIGYEIIVPENLGSFENQLNTFYEARTIVSTTSSGLTNSVFMQPGQTVIELATPLIIHVPNNAYSLEDKAEQWHIQEELHHFYSILAFHKKHNFLMLANKYRRSEEIIEQIENDKFLKTFLARN